MPVVSVESAEDGLALLEQRNRDGSPDPFGLVILDWLLPGMNGIDAAARIRTRGETRALPIIMISAYAGKEEEARCAELGGTVFLRKPLTASSMFDAVVAENGALLYRPSDREMKILGDRPEPALLVPGVKVVFRAVSQ